MKQRRLVAEMQTNGSPLCQPQETHQVDIFHAIILSYEVLQRFHLVIFSTN
jgi:hypothetical protein